MIGFPLALRFRLLTVGDAKVGVAKWPYNLHRQCTFSQTISQSRPDQLRVGHLGARKRPEKSPTVSAMYTYTRPHTTLAGAPSFLPSSRAAAERT